MERGKFFLPAYCWLSSRRNISKNGHLIVEGHHIWNLAAICSFTPSVQPFPKQAGEGADNKNTKFIGDIKAIRLIRHDDSKSMQTVVSCQLILHVHLHTALSCGCSICLFQSLNSDTFFNISNMIGKLCSSITTLLCILYGPKHLYNSVWLKGFIIPSALVVGNAPLWQWTLVLKGLRTALP